MDGIRPHTSLPKLLVAPATRLPEPHAPRSPLLELPEGAQPPLEPRTSVLFVVYVFTYQNHPAGPGRLAGPRGGCRDGLAPPAPLCPQDRATSLPSPAHTPRAGMHRHAPHSSLLTAPRAQVPCARRDRGGSRSQCGCPEPTAQKGCCGDPGSRALGVSSAALSLGRRPPRLSGGPAEADRDY